MDTGNRIQASGIADIRQALGNDPDQKFFIIAKVHISFGMGDQLRFASALGSEKTKCDQFTLL